MGLHYLLAYAGLLAYGITFLRIGVRRDYARRGRLSVVVAILQALLFFIYGGFPYLYLPDDWPAVHVNPIIHLSGLLFIITGLGFLLYGMIRLGPLKSLGLGKRRLAQTGIYRKTRNPQALACGLYVIGFTMLWPSWYAVGWALLYFVLIHTMIITEEEHLLRIHDEDYSRYCREVPRYFMFRQKKDTRQI